MIQANYNPREDAKIPQAIDKKNKRFVIDYKDDKIQSCITIFRRIPWLKDEVEQVLVNPINLPENYYDKNNFTEYNNTKFYQVTLNYYKMRCGSTLISVADDVANVNFEDQNYTFQVGLLLRRQNTKVFVVQNENMYSDEKVYLENLKKSNINISDLKQGHISGDLIKIGVNAISDCSPDVAYTRTILRGIEDVSSNAYEFSVKVSKIMVGCKFGNLFPKRLKKGYYNANIVHLLDYDTLLEGTVYDEERINQYVDDSAINMLIYASRFNEIPDRKYARDNKKNLNLDTVDVRIRCENIDDVKDVPEENIAFYDFNKKYYCYDIPTLYENFKVGNYLNQYSGERFSQEFIDKVTTLYTFKKNFISETHNITDMLEDNLGEDYEDRYHKEPSVEVDPAFEFLLSKVREEIDGLFINSDTCKVCQKSVGRMGIFTVGDNGEILKHCTKKCFESVA